MLLKEKIDRRTNKKTDSAYLYKEAIIFLLTQQIQGYISIGNIMDFKRIILAKHNILITTDEANRILEEALNDLKR
jgi:hypothetical protein